jgi:hypothetical protein
MECKHAFRRAPVMAEISSTPKPSMACRMKASRWFAAMSRRAGGDEAHHFVGADDLFRRGHAIVGDDGFFGDGFVGLVELQFGLVAGLDVGLAGGFFQAHGAAVASLGAGELIERIDGQAVEPGLEGQALGLFSWRCRPIAQRGGDGFVDHFFFADRIPHNLIGGLAEINFAFHKALEAGKIHVDVGAHVVGEKRSAETPRPASPRRARNIVFRPKRPFAGASTCAGSAAVLCVY